MPIACPTCGKDDQIQKVSVIFESGTQTLGGTVGGGGAGINLSTGHVSLGGGGGGLSGVQQSVLAQKLAPPASPQRHEKRVGGAILFGVFLLLVGFNPPRAGMGPGAIECFIGAIALFCGVYLWRKNLQKKTAEYQAAYTQWDRLWYCHRDGATFNV